MTPMQRAQYMAGVAKQRAQEQRAANRAAMPLTAAIIDQFRSVFGKLPRGSFTENGHTVTWGGK